MMKSYGVVFLMAGLILAVGVNHAQAGLAVDFTSVTTDFTNNNWSRLVIHREPVRHGESPGFLR